MVDAESGVALHRTISGGEDAVDLRPHIDLDALRMRRGPGLVRRHLDDRRDLDRHDVLPEGKRGNAKKRNGAWQFKQKFFDFPAFWLNNPGTYYWQAYSTICNGSDCYAEGPVVRFKVK